ncbi:hypothetical protein [Olsenella intestinalis]|uniref:hypothetical protein n=1 Tax=Olsenella intestinalis TaxID=2930083 RepID=UPI002010620A|nr:hypothetical protein [Olsenella intestinalis]
MERNNCKSRFEILPSRAIFAAGLVAWLDLASVTRAFLRQIVRENRILPDLLGTEPNAESLESIREAGQIIDAGGSGYASAAEMFDAMGL